MFVPNALHLTYNVSLVFHLVTVILTLQAVSHTSWLVSRVHVGDLLVTTSYGLFTKCESSSNTCRSFPEDYDCDVNGGGLCFAWRHAAFAMCLAVLCQASALITYVHAILKPNNFTTQTSWKILCVLLGLSVVLQALGSLTLAVIVEHHELFKTGHWRLGWCWAFVTASWVLEMMLVMSLGIVGLMSPNDYLYFYDSDLEDDEEEEDDEDEGQQGQERDDFYYYRRETSRRYNYS